MGRLVKFLAFLVAVGFVALTVFAYVADLTPERREVSEPVTLDVE